MVAQLKDKRTEFTGYFYLPESKQWKKLVTFSKLTDGKTNLRGYYSLIEDFKRSWDFIDVVPEGKFRQRLDKEDQRGMVLCQ